MRYGVKTYGDQGRYSTKTVGKYGELQHLKKKKHHYSNLVKAPVLTANIVYSKKNQVKHSNWNKHKTD